MVLKTAGFSMILCRSSQFGPKKNSEFFSHHNMLQNNRIMQPVMLIYFSFLLKRNSFFFDNTKMKIISGILSGSGDDMRVAVLRAGRGYDNIRTAV